MSNDRVEGMWTHFNDMSEDEIRRHIRQIRADRKIKKTSVTKVKKVAKQKANAEEKTKTLFKGLSPEAIARLIEELEGK